KPCSTWGEYCKAYIYCRHSCFIPEQEFGCRARIHKRYRCQCQEGALSLETMFPKILLPLKKELEQVEQRIQQEMKIRAGHISQLINLQLHWWDKYLHPAVLILSGRMFGYSHPKMFTMACV